MGNIVYNVLDDLQDDFPQLFEDDIVPVNGWEQMPQEPTKHNFDDFTNER